MFAFQFFEISQICFNFLNNSERLLSLTKITMILVIIILLIIISLYLYLTKNHNYWKNMGVPFEKPKFLFGSLLPLVQQKVSRNDFFRNMYASTTHPYYGFFTLTKPSILLRDIALIKKILIHDFENFSDRISSPSNYDIVSHGLFFMQGERWKQMRNTLSSLFSSKKLRNMFPYLLDVGENMVDYIKNETINRKSLNFMDIMCMYNTDIISTCFFGIKTEALDRGDKKFYTMSLELTKPTFSRTMQANCILLVPRLANILKMRFFDPTAQNYLQSIFLDVWNHRKIGGYARGDLVDLLIKAEKENLFSNEEIFAQPIPFHFAAFDTSCNSIALTLIELCLNSEAQTKLREEVKQVLANHASLSYEALKEMNYLNMVVSESLRIHPIVPIIDRICTKDYKVPNSNVIIEKGIPVVVSIQGIHRDSQYFPNPDKFDPERFSQTNKLQMIPGTYVPFGDGYRNCIGLRLALLSIKVALVKIVDNFEVELGETFNSIAYDAKSFFITPQNKFLNLKFTPLKIQSY